MKAALILACGLLTGYALAQHEYGTAIDRCDTEVLQLQAQLTEDREAYFREQAECEAGKTP